MDDLSDASMDFGEEEEQHPLVTRNLGYRVQKELWFNRHLPYADRIDDESQRLLETIKRNFSQALVHREMNPGLGICGAQLMW